MDYKYWEDLSRAPARRFGPVIFSSELLDTLLDLMGERHPIHDVDRVGTLMGQGGAAILVERADAARQRNAPILGR